MAKKQIFRQGQDIFAIEGDSARLLKPTEFDRDFASDAPNVMDFGQNPSMFKKFFPTQIKTPTDPVVDPVTDPVVDPVTDPVVDPNNLPNRFGDVRSRIDELFEGLDTVVTPESIEEQRLKENQERASLADSIFNPRIAEARRVGERREGSTEAQLGIKRGLGASSPKLSFINEIQRENDNTIKEIERQKADFIRSGDFEAATRASQAVSQLQQQKINLAIQKTSLVFDMLQEDRAQEKFDIEKNALEEVDPFFKGSDVVSLMKEIPVGTTQNLVDPNTGVEYTLTGLATDDPNVKQFTATNDQGDFTIINFDVEKNAPISQSTIGGVGKTKTRAASTTIVLNQQQQSDLSEAQARLAETIDENGKYDTATILKEAENYAISNPGKKKQFLDAFSGNIDWTDESIRQVYGKFTQSTEDDPFAGIMEKYGNLEPAE